MPRRGSAQLGIVFKETLLDENAACHIAWGAAIRDSFADGLPDDAAALEARGVNESDVHQDVMIGGPEVAVTGLTRGRRRDPRADRRPLADLGSDLRPADPGSPTRPSRSLSPPRDLASGSSGCRLGRGSVLAAKLRAVQLGVEAARREQLVVAAALDDAAVAQHQDLVGVAHRREPVGDDQ